MILSQFVKCELILQCKSFDVSNDIGLEKMTRELNLTIMQLKVGIISWVTYFAMYLQTSNHINIQHLQLMLLTFQFAKAILKYAEDLFKLNFTETR